MGSPDVYRDAQFATETKDRNLIAITSLNQLKDLKGIQQSINILLFNKSKRFRDIHEICEALWTTKFLVTVDLGSNFINDELCESLCKALQPSHNSLQLLNLAGNCIGGSGAASLGSLLAFCKKLAVLSLRLNNIGDEGASALSNGLKRNKSLTTLNLSANSIGIYGATALTEALARNQQLKILDLTGNFLQDEGIEQIAQLLSTSSLNVLKLSCNDITFKGGIALGNAVKRNGTLECLELSVNTLSDSGTIAVAEALVKNSTLKKLDLGDNKIGDNGAFAVAHSLTTNKNLTYLNLASNEISKSGCMALVNSLIHQPNLLQYNFSGNQISTSDFETLVKILEEKTLENRLSFLQEMASFEVLSSKDYSKLDVDIRKSPTLQAKVQKHPQKDQSPPSSPLSDSTPSQVLINKIDDIIEKIATKSKSPTRPSNFASNVHNGYQSPPPLPANYPLLHLKSPPSFSVASLLNSLQANDRNGVRNIPPIDSNSRTNRLIRQSDVTTYSEPPTENKYSNFTLFKDQETTSMRTYLDNPTSHESKLDILRNDLEGLNILQNDNTSLKQSKADPAKNDADVIKLKQATEKLLSSDIGQDIQKEVRAIKEAIEIEEHLTSESTEDQEPPSLGIQQEPREDILPTSNVEEKLDQAIKTMKEKLAEDLIAKGFDVENVETDSKSNKSSRRSSIDSSDSISYEASSPVLRNANYLSTDNTPSLPVQTSSLNNSQQSYSSAFSADSESAETHESTKSPSTSKTSSQRSSIDLDKGVLETGLPREEMQPTITAIHKLQSDDDGNSSQFEKDEERDTPRSEMSSGHVSRTSTEENLRIVQQKLNDELEVVTQDDLTRDIRSRSSPVVPTITVTESDTEDFEKTSAHSAPFLKSDTPQPFFITRSRSGSTASHGSRASSPKEAPFPIPDSDKVENIEPKEHTEKKKSKKHKKKDSSEAQASVIQPDPNPSPRTVIQQPTSSTSQTTAQEKLMHHPQIPEDVYLPTLSNTDLAKVKNYFVNGGASFPMIWHKTEGKKEKHIKVTLDFSNREHLILTEKKTIGLNKITKVKISHNIKVSLSMRFPGAFEIESTDIAEGSILVSGDNRDIIIALLVLYCFGFSVIKKMARS